MGSGHGKTEVEKEEAMKWFENKWDEADKESKGVLPLSTWEVAVRGPRLVDIIETRHCCHSFDPKRAVPLCLIRRILTAARNVQSTNNTQPWSVVVVQGKQRTALSDAMLVAYDSGDLGKAQYANRPPEMKKAGEPAPVIARMKDVMSSYSKTFYGHLGIDHKDAAAKKRVYRANYTFWGAPVHMILCAPAEAVAGTYMDMGAYLTAILLGAHSLGLGGKPQFSVAKLHHICRKVLGKKALPDKLQVLCGISIGYPADGSDPRTHPGFFPTRLSVDETTTWVVDEGATTA